MKLSVTIKTGNGAAGQPASKGDKVSLYKHKSLLLSDRARLPISPGLKSLS